MPAPPLTLLCHCAICPQNTKLSRCQGCLAIFYCSRAHQIAHRPLHKAQCINVKRATSNLAQATQVLINEQSGTVTHPGAGATMFEQQVGRFWGIYETRPYMRARYQLARKILDVDTQLAVTLGLDHFLEMLKLCRSDNMGVREETAPLFLRLGRDQECYDFLKWWACGAGEDYDWGDMSLPFMDFKNEDVFESVEIGMPRAEHHSLIHLATMTLLKIRLLNDLTSLQNSSLISTKVPVEILDHIRTFIPSPPIHAHKEIMTSTDNIKPWISLLEGQITQLYLAIAKRNSYFWPGMLHADIHLMARPESYSQGSVEEMQIALGSCYASWAETGSALEKVGMLLGNDDSGGCTCGGEHEEEVESEEEDEEEEEAWHGGALGWFA